MVENINAKNDLKTILEQYPGFKILDATGFAIAILDSKLKIIWANREYLRIQGKLEDNIEGRYCYEVSFGYDNPCPKNFCPTQRTLKTGLEDKTLGVLYKTNKGIQYLDVYCFPLKNPNGEIAQVMEVIYDNTRLYELIRLSEDANIVVSHELKSPLSSIAYIARAILESDMTPEKMERFLYRIISRAEGALAMIDEFLTLSSISLGELKIDVKRVNFQNEVIEKALDQQKETMAEKGMSARIDIPWELEVVCDPRYMQILYNNLLTNAAKYGTIGTEIYLGHVGPQDGYHYFNVINVGDWIKESDRERIFEKYITLGKRGFGIGLHTAKEILKKHGGDIWVEPCYFATGRWVTQETINDETMIAEEYLHKLPKGNSFVFKIPAKYIAPSNNGNNELPNKKA